MVAVVLFFMIPQYAILFLLDKNIYMVVFSFYIIPTDCIPVLVVSTVNYFPPRLFHKLKPVRLTGVFLEGEIFIPSFHSRVHMVGEVGGSVC